MAPHQRSYVRADSLSVRQLALLFLAVVVPAIATLVWLGIRLSSRSGTCPRGAMWNSRKRRPTPRSGPSRRWLRRQRSQRVASVTLRGSCRCRRCRSPRSRVPIRDSQRQKPGRLAVTYCTRQSGRWGRRGTRGAVDVAGQRPPTRLSAAGRARECDRSPATCRQVGFGPTASPWTRRTDRACRGTRGGRSSNAHPPQRWSSSGIASPRQERWSIAQVDRTPALAQAISAARACRLPALLVL